MTFRQKMLPLLLLAISLLCRQVAAAEMQEVRIRAGLDLFTSLLAADMNLEEKKGSDGALLLMLVYTDNRDEAEKLASRIEKVGSIRGMPIRATILYVNSLGRFFKQKPAGIFLTQPISDSLDDILAYGRENHIVVFSPFEGDVERGVAGGIYISDRLLPYLNIAALKSSDLHIKSFFLRVSKRYGE
jgi:hypothetical protein